MQQLNDHIKMTMSFSRKMASSSQRRVSCAEIEVNKLWLQSQRNAVSLRRAFSFDEVKRRSQISTCVAGKPGNTSDELEKGSSKEHSLSKIVTPKAKTKEQKYKVKEDRLREIPSFGAHFYETQQDYCGVCSQCVSPKLPLTRCGNHVHATVLHNRKLRNDNQNVLEIEDKPRVKTQPTVSPRRRYSSVVTAMECYGKHRYHHSYNSHQEAVLVKNNNLAGKYGARSCPNLNCNAKPAVTEKDDCEKDVDKLRSKAMAWKREIWPHIKFSGSGLTSSNCEESKTASKPVYSRQKCGNNCEVQFKSLPKIQTRPNPEGASKQDSLAKRTETLLGKEASITNRLSFGQDGEQNTSASDSDSTFGDTFKTEESLLSYAAQTSNRKERVNMRPRVESPIKTTRGRDSILIWISEVNQNLPELFD